MSRSEPWPRAGDASFAWSGERVEVGRSEGNGFMPRLSVDRRAAVIVRAMSVVAACVLGLVACGDGAEAPVDAGADAPGGDAVADADVTQDPIEAEEPAAQPTRANAAPPNLAAAPPPSAPDLETADWVLSPPFYAAGDEPYWRLDILDGWFVFRRAGLPEIEAPLAPPRREGDADLFVSPPLTIQMSKSGCQTANGETSQFTASVLFDDVIFSGCGFAGQSAGSSAEGTAIADSIRAVDSCLERLGDVAVVTGIYERGDRNTALGMRTRDGRLFECVTEGGGSMVAFLDQVEPGAAGPWLTSGMRFLRGGQGADACAEAEAVTGGDDVLGHMLPGSCRF